MILVAFIGLTFQGADAPKVNPALLVSRGEVDQIWSKGIADGKKRKALSRAIGLSQRQIDSYHVSRFSKEGCSWATFMHPKLVCYTRAHKAGSQYWSDEEIQKAKADILQFADVTPKVITFQVDLSEMPSFQGAYGTLSRYADPQNLTDVRCVLKVGSRIIQPEVQPGDLTLATSDQSSTFVIPVTTYIYGSNRTNAFASGYGGFASGSATTYSSYQVTTQTAGTESYRTYSGNFTVQFKLFGEDGVPLIQPTDKTVQLIVSKKSAELHADYVLADWLKAFAK